jgi:phenylacetic acid degradation operon negative regulatory protein
VPKTSFQDLCKKTIHAFQKEPPSRTPSLIATVFGDVIESHGREVWLGSLTSLLEPLGISERLVRTSVYRLSQDETLVGTKIGRRSYYTLTASARARVQRFDHQIYYFKDETWDGNWRLIFTGTYGINAEKRAEIRKFLTWLGYGIIAPNVYGHPTASLDPVWELFERIQVTDKVVVLTAHNYDQVHGLGTHEMVRQCFGLHSLEAEYQAFNEQFRPLADALDNPQNEQPHNPEHSFILRSMLIHQYRRILLSDPALPAALLPENWPGIEAQQLCGKIYQAILEASEYYIQSICESQSGLFSEISEAYVDRFAGLDAALKK